MFVHNAHRSSEEININGGAGEAVSHGAIVHGRRRLTEREEKNGTRRFSPVDNAARVHLHESFPLDHNRAPGIALAERRFHVDRTSVDDIGENERRGKDLLDQRGTG